MKDQRAPIAPNAAFLISFGKEIMPEWRAYAIRHEPFIWAPVDRLNFTRRALRDVRLLALLYSKSKHQFSDVEHVEFRALTETMIDEALLLSGHPRPGEKGAVSSDIAETLAQITQLISPH